MIEFNNIANSFKSLSIAFIEIETIENIEVIKSLMFALLDNLRDWLEHVFIDKSAIDIHYMDNSFVNDSLAIEAMLRNHHEEEDDETCDIFF